jgi:hypothetical protein
MTERRLPALLDFRGSFRSHAIPLPAAIVLAIAMSCTAPGGVWSCPAAGPQPSISGGGDCPVQPAQQSGADNVTCQLTAVLHDDALFGLGPAHAWQRVLWLVENAESPGFHTTPERPPRGAE